MTLQEFIQSSANPEEVSLTVKGILTSFVPLVLLVLQLKGVQLPAGTIDNFVNQIVAISASIAGAIGGILTLVGLARKCYFFLKNTFIKQ